MTIMMMTALTNLLIRKVNLVVLVGVLAALVMYIGLMGFIDMVIIFVIIITIIANQLQGHPERVLKVNSFAQA